MLGILWMVASALLLAIQNVTLKILFADSIVFGSVSLGGYLEPSLGHSLLLLEMRTALMLLGMFLLAPLLRPSVFQELKGLVRSPNSSLLLKVIASGTLLAIALTLLFVAISQLPSGIAVTIFFIYPPVSAILAWFVFGERLSVLAGLATLGVCVGVCLAAPSWSHVSQSVSLWGLLAAIGAGVAYAWQGIFCQMCLKRIHPVSFSLLLFGIVFVVCGAGLGLVSLDVPDQAWLPLWIGSGVTASVSMGAYLLNNFGIRAIGVALAFLASATTPILTVLLAWLAISEGLIPRQVMGVLFVVIGILVVGVERLQQARGHAA